MTRILRGLSTHGVIVHIDDLDGALEANSTSGLPAVPARHLVIVHSGPGPQRRRAPRRTVVGPFAEERRRADRRRRRPGIDGLLRLVLSDKWPE